MNRFTLPTALLSLLLVLVAKHSYSQIFPELGGQRAGISALTFLKNDINPRSVGMGGMSVPMTGDAYSVAINPALVNDIRTMRFGLSNRTIIEGLNQSFFSAVVPFREFSNFAFSVNTLNSGSMEKRTEFQPDGTGETFAVSNTSFGLTYASTLSDAFAIGVTAKYINETMAEYVDHNLSIDLGFRYRTDYRNLTFAVALRDFGLNSSLSGDEVGSDFNRDEVTVDDASVATMFSFGVMADVYHKGDHQVLGGVQLNHPNDNAESLHFGFEYNFRDQIYGRAGYKVNVDFEAFPTFGIGYDFSFGHSILRLDYGFNPSTGLGLHPTFQGSTGEATFGIQHVLGISFFFGKDARPALNLNPSAKGYKSSTVDDAVPEGNEGPDLSPNDQ